MTRNEIVVGIDGSRAAEAALLWAAAEARRRRARLVIAYASEETEPGPDPAHPSGFAQALLLDAAALVFESDLECDLQTVIRAEPAARMLTDLAASSAMLVLGSHGVGRVAGSLLGSVAYRAAAHARCPVAIIADLPTARRSSEPDHGAEVRESARPVSVGVSANAEGNAALEFAFAEAASRRVGLIVVHSLAAIDWTESAATAVYRPGADFEAHQRARLAELLAPLIARYPSVSVETVVVGDSVTEALSQVADRSCMLVLGCRHTGDAVLRRLGPVASRLIHLGQCPVMIVPPAAMESTHNAAPSGNEAAHGRVECR
jgi:nucleotide-binding universal stress UspA family protein